MAKYQVTFELTTRLSREVEADSTAQAERFAEAMYQEYLKGDNHIPPDLVVKFQPIDIVDVIL